MKETDYQALFERCIDPDHSLAKELALSKLQQIIYFFPVKRFGTTWDVAGDFYLFAQKHTAALLKGYQKQQEKVSFQIYLSVKLRSLFRNFLRRRKRERNTTDDPVEWDDQLTLSVVSEEKPQERRIIRELYRAIAELDFEEQVTLKLHYSLPLTIGDIRNLAQRRHLKEVFCAYRACLNERKKSYKKLEKELTRAEKYLALLDNRAREAKEKIAAAKMRHDTMIRLLPFVGHIKLGSIAAVLGEHQSTTSRRLKNAEAKLKKIISQNLGLKLTE